MAVVLAFAFGYGLTIAPGRPVLAPGDRRRPLQPRTGCRSSRWRSSTTGFILAVPGAIDAGLTHLLFWATLAASLAVAFVVTVPVNLALIARGKGHAVVHEFHH